MARDEPSAEIQPARINISLRNRMVYEVRLLELRFASFADSYALSTPRGLKPRER